MLTKGARSEALHKLVRWLQRSDPGRRPTPLLVGRLRFGGAGATTGLHRVAVLSRSSSRSFPTPTRRLCSPAWRRSAIEVCGPPAILAGISGRSGWTAIGSSTHPVCGGRQSRTDPAGLGRVQQEDAEDTAGCDRAREETSGGLAATRGSEAPCARQAFAAPVRVRGSQARCSWGSCRGPVGSRALRQPDPSGLTNRSSPDGPRDARESAGC